MTILASIPIIIFFKKRCSYYHNSTLELILQSLKQIWVSINTVIFITPYQQHIIFFLPHCSFRCYWKTQQQEEKEILMLRLR